jgi:hypothetical protein
MYCTDIHQKLYAHVIFCSPTTCRCVGISSTMNRASIHCLWSLESPPVAGPADHSSIYSFFLLNLFVWWGLSCDLFPLPSPPYFSNCDSLNVGSASLPVWLSSEADVWSANQNSVWDNLILNCCLDISVAAGMEPSRKPCRGIEN